MDRFWSKVQKAAGCWLWTGATTGDGYGKIGIDGRTVLAHRLAWELTYGPIPPGLQVLHSCDNPPCVNPAHLFLGTNADNNADMIAKGRARYVSRRGERNGRAKLTETQVIDIRRRHEDGEAGTVLVEAFGVSRQMVFLITKRLRWCHL